MHSYDNDIPLVSVIMNAFNGERYLDKALKSVLAQSYTNWELIFWDNQSTDKTADIILSYNDGGIIPIKELDRLFKETIHEKI